MTGPPSLTDQQAAPDRAELPPRAASVTTARRRVRAFAVSHRLPEEVVDVLSLVASELVTNSVLHARTALLLTLELRPGVVRVSVHDRFPAAPMVHRYPLEALTGRGLGVVAALSRAWSVDAVKDGKVVWAEVALDGGMGTGPDGPQRSGGRHRIPARPGSNTARAVRFPGVPVAAYLALQEHNDALYRELELLAAERDSDPATAAARPLRLRVLAQRLLGPEFRGARNAHRETVAAAQARGQATVDLQMRASVETVALARDYVALLDEADDYCRAGVLLTTPPHQRVTALRHWFVEQLAAQRLEGRQPAPPSL